MLSMIFLLGCKEEAQPMLKEQVDDTAVQDTSSEDEDCAISIAGTQPSDGAGEWFYRDSIRVTFSEPNPTVAFAVADASGAEVSVSFEWDDERLNASILPEAGAWLPSENYAVTIDLCGNQPQFGFGTSNLGAPLDIDHEELVGRTYFIDLSSAVYSEPPGVGSLLSLFLDMPLLLGVDSIASETIDYEAYLGYQDDVTGDWNSYVMDPWLFSGADFSQEPYFDAFTELMAIPYGEVQIPVHDFNISGTFAPNGSAIHNAQFSGIGNTSGMGVLMGFGNDPDAVCTLLGDYGISCQDCPDGAGTYCVRLAGTIDEAEQLVGLDVTQ